MFCPCTVYAANQESERLQLFSRLRELLLQIKQNQSITEGAWKCKIDLPACLLGLTADLL